MRPTNMSEMFGPDPMDMHNAIKEQQIERRERQARKHTQNQEQFDAYMDAYGNDGVHGPSTRPLCQHCGANEIHSNHPASPEHWSSYDPNFYPPEY